MTTSVFMLCVSSNAFAREDGSRARDSGLPPALANAWELTIAKGFSQGFGSADRALGLGDYAKGGLSTRLGFGYRFESPRLVRGAPIAEVAHRRSSRS